MAVRKPKGQKEAQEEPEKYSMNPAFWDQAFSWYCKGMSLPKVADVLRMDWPEVSTRTLQRLAQENQWEKARSGYLDLHRQAAASAEGVVPEVILQLQRLRNKLECKAAMSAQEMFAYRAICEDLLYYTGKHPKLKDSTPLAVSSDMEVAALLEAIAEDDVVGGAWKRRRSHIEKAYRAKLEKKETAKIQYDKQVKAAAKLEKKGTAQVQYEKQSKVAKGAKGSKPK